MRQVTGSNPISTTNKVSIQLRLGGHSFSCDMLPQKPSEDAVVEVELLTANSIVVPTECFEPSSAKQLLQLSGVEYSDDESVVWSRDFDGVTAIMVVPKHVIDHLIQAYGDCIDYTSPLLHSIRKGGQYLYIYNAEGLAYFKFYENSICRFCEAMPTNSYDDILYFIESIIQIFDSKRTLIGVAGDDIENLIKLLQQYYKVEKCE